MRTSTNRRMMTLLFLSFLILFCTCDAISPDHDRKFCSRIFLKGIDGGEVAHLQLLGVYVKHNVSWSNFPAYKHEQENLYLYMDIEDHSIHLGKQGMRTPILKASLQNMTVEEAVLLSRDNPYNTLIEHWFSFDPIERSYIQLSDQSMQIICVEEDFVLCRSGNLNLRGGIPVHLRLIESGDDVPASWISDVTEIKFFPHDGGFKNMRAVYEVVGFYNILYLSYDGKYWEITENWMDDYPQRHVVFRVRDTALRPEYITGTWELNQNGTYHPVDTLQLRCRGISAGPDGACTTNYPCHNHAGCKYIFRSISNGQESGEILCMCGPAHQGQMCADDLPSCSRTPGTEGREAMPDHALSYSRNGHNLGDVTTYFCSPDSVNKFFYSKCQLVQLVNRPETLWLDHGDCEHQISLAHRTHQHPTCLIFLLLLMLLTS